MIENFEYTPLIIPTVLIPFTMISVGISVVATFIAGLFGVKLKWEGPKQLLEVLMKPRVLFTALILNAVGYGIYYGYNYVDSMPAFMRTIKKNHIPIKAPQQTYKNTPFRANFSKESQAKTKEFSKVEQVWKINLSKGSFRGAHINGSSFFLGSDDGNIYELSIESGKIFRKFFVGNTVTPGSIIWDGKLYNGEGVHSTHHARVYKYDLATGSTETFYNTKGHTEGQTIIGSYKGKDMLIVVAGSDGIHAVDLKTMEKVWRNDPGHMDAAARVENGIVYVGTGREKGDRKKYKTYAVAYDFLTGKEIWKNETPASCWMEPAITKDYVCFVMGEVYFKTDLGGVSCYNKKTGEPEFSILNKAPLLGIPFVLGDDIIFSDSKGKVCRIDSKKRKKSWCFESKAKGFNMTSVSYDKKNNTLAFTTRSEGVFFLNPKTGKKIAHFNPSKDQGEWLKTYASASATPTGWITVDIKGTVRKLVLK